MGSAVMMQSGYQENYIVQIKQSGIDLYDLVAGVIGILRKALGNATWQQYARTNLFAHRGREPLQDQQPFQLPEPNAPCSINGMVISRKPYLL
jgi:hypothetical protein